jgi:hypothetical protein
MLSESEEVSDEEEYVPMLMRRAEAPAVPKSSRSIEHDSTVSHGLPSPAANGSLACWLAVQTVPNC